MAKLAYGLIVAVATGALAKGITTWGDLDSKVVELLQIVATPKNISIIAWSISGVAGLIATVLWIVFRIDERLYDIIQPRPMFASLVPTPHVLPLIQLASPQKARRRRD